MFLGQTVLRLCPSSKRECRNVHCAFQPFCQCARADLAASRKIETRVWTAFACCGMVVVVLAFVWAATARP
jgi:hypothetical protein